MFGRQARLDRERQTFRLMTGIYCRDHHGKAGDLCNECQSLFDYAMQRVDKCPYQADKPTCAKCPIHCYKPAMREKVYLVMRYAGPRMMRYHPLLTLMHYMDGITRSRKG